MGELQNPPTQLFFNASLKIDFQGSRVTSDGNLILVRELDERLGFGKLTEQHLTDSRRGNNTQFNLSGQSVYSCLAAYRMRAGVWIAELRLRTGSWGVYCGGRGCQNGISG